MIFAFQCIVLQKPGISKMTTRQEYPISGWLLHQSLCVFWQFPMRFSCLAWFGFSTIHKRDNISCQLNNKKTADTSYHFFRQQRQHEFFFLTDAEACWRGRIRTNSSNMLIWQSMSTWVYVLSWLYHFIKGRWIWIIVGSYLFDHSAALV